MTENDFIAWLEEFGPMAFIESAQDILNAASTILFQLATRDYLCLYGHIFQSVLGASTGNDHFFQTVCLQSVLC